MATNYERAQQRFPRQKAALTRALNSKDPAKVKTACQKAVREWDEDGTWPDDWSRWQRALDDVLDWREGVRLEDLR